MYFFPLLSVVFLKINIVETYIFLIACKYILLLLSSAC